MGILGIEDVLCWSAAEQAFWTQGVISSVRPGTLQWHSKSVREEQPSLPSVVTKQLSCGLLAWLIHKHICWQCETYRAAGEVRDVLGVGNGGQREGNGSE